MCQERIKTSRNELVVILIFVSFGNNVEIASGGRFIIHEIINLIRQYGLTVKESMGEIVIDYNIFIGAGTIILPGVTIASNAIVGVEIMVNKNLPVNSMCRYAM